MKPLHGHTSPETAYLVADYPYGRSRCRIRYWIEQDKRKALPQGSPERLNLLRWAIQKAAYCQACLNGACFTVNGEKKPWTADDDKRHAAELATWKHVVELTKTPKEIA